MSPNDVNPAPCGPAFLRTLTRASRKITTEPNPAQALWDLVCTLRADLGIDRAGVFAFDRQSGTLSRVTGVAEDGQPEFGGRRIDTRSGGGPLREVTRREIPYYFTDDAPRDYPDHYWAPGVRAHAIIPIIAGNELLGVLCADNSLSGRPIPEGVLEPLFLYAGLAALPLFTLHQQQERERTDEMRWALLREVFLAVTSGRVRLCGQSEVREEWPALEDPFWVRAVEDVPLVREAVREAAVSAGMEGERARDFELCASEAATNALLHGNGGFVTVGCREGRIRVRVADQGTGIPLQDLPGAALQPGWSRRRSMGLGFTLINETADRVFLYTGADGTTVIIEMGVEPQVNLPAECNPLLWGESLAV
jgi:anti-sigma regulatory factor (Ser/Thr protein kinase)